MKNSVLKTLRILVATCFAVLLFGASALLAAPTLMQAKAEGTLASNEYRTDGASVRVFQRKIVENGEETFEETARQGIRFHVEMGAGYVYGGQTILNTAEKHERGSFKMTEGFKTYTLVLPTRLLNGELSADTDKVMKIDTSEYWLTDKYGNWESVAYIHSIPESMYTDKLSFRGILCTVAEDGTETMVAQTDVAERSLAWVAKQAYNDTIKEDFYWGSQENDNTAAPLIKKFVPTYSITYKDASGNELGEEEVLWGDKPQNAPNVETDAWYDTENSEEISINDTMNWTGNRTLELVTTSSEAFVLTGVAAETDFEVNDNTYHGVKVFATLHRESFAAKTEMDIHAVNVEHKRGDEVLCDGIELQGVWTMEEQNSLGEWQMLLFFALDTSTLENGDEVIIKGDSVFYAKGVMYKLTEDYTIDYTKVENVEDYGMYLGDLYNSDVFTLTNCSEDSSGNNGNPDEFTIRVEFYEDVMVNGEFTFEFGPEADTSKYPYPVYIRCGNDENYLIPIAGGRYYWNEGDHKILELIGAGEYANKVFGWHNGDELIGAPGTIVKQNGGYYIFQDEMYAYFLADGSVDKWGYALGDWVVGEERAKYTTSEFAAEGSVTETTDYGTLADEIRINTTTHWFGQSKVSLLTTEKMLDSAPYAIYCTSADGTVTEINKVRYHGQTNPDGGNYQILGLCGNGKFTVGDVVTIAAGTRFWLGTEYYTLTEEITYYYNGNFWVQNYDESTMGTLTSASFGDRAHNQGATELRMYFTAPLAGYTTTDGGAFDELRIGTGNITFNGNPVSYVRYQRWDANSTWLSFGGYSGSVAFGDKLVIEAGTTIWGPNKVAYKFTEKVEWIYAANPADTNRTWSRVRGGVTVDVDAENATVSGAGTFAVGQTYTLNVASTGDYLISAVIVNNKELPLNASNTYTFTVEQSNVIKVKTVVGHKVFFTVPEGATVNGGGIANGGFGAVAHGGSYTFSVAVADGYKLTGVSGATNNGDGTYTVSNVTANTTVTVSVEKLYKVTYSGDNVTVTANVANGAWVDNGTTVTFTISVGSDYTLIGVTNATKVNATTYTATVNGADLNVTASALKNDAFVDITDRIQIEDRTWGAHTNEVYVGVLDTGVTYTDGNGNENHYFNTSVNDTWYVGNDAPITNNGGVDIMEYILVNGVSARTLITTNANGVRNSNACGCWLSNPAAYPVYVETTNGSGLMMRFATAEFGTEFTITIKAGFRITDANGDLVAVTKDINFFYANATITKEVITSQYSVEFANVTGANISVTANGNAVNSGDKVAEGTEVSVTVTPAASHNLTSVKINGVEKGTGGTYSFTAMANVTIEVSTAIKTYTVTANCSGGVTADKTSATVNHGSSVTFNLTIPANATIKANGTVINGTSYTVNNVTANTTVTFETWYNVTFKAGNATVSGDAAGLYKQGDTFDFTVADTVSHRVTGVTANSTSLGTAAGTYSHKVTGATTISVTTPEKTKYTITWDANITGVSTVSVTANETGNVTNGGTVYDGQTLTVKVTASSGYRLNTVTIGGAAQSGVNTSQAGSSTFNYTVKAATSISATTVKMYQITWTTGNFSISGVTNGGWYDENSTQSVTITPSQNYAMTSIKVNGGSNVGSSTYMTAAETISVTVSRATSIVVTTEAYPTITITPNNATVTLNGESYTSKKSVQIPKGSYTVKVADRTSWGTTYTVTGVSITGSVSGTTSGSAAGDYPITVSGDVTITVTVTEDGGCLVEGTIVTLADGTKKPVENLKAGDMLLVFNHETGTYDVAPLLVNTHATAEADYYTVISLQFSNGEVLKIADEHAVFSKTANKYVYINASNAYEFIGHEFVSSVYENNVWVSKTVTLDNVTITEECVRIFTPVSAWHMNVIAGNMLTLSGRTVNFFEYDETMKYNEEKMQEDIEKYGLYTYEDFKDYVPEEVFNAFPFKYFKVAIEKGEYSWEQLMFLLSEYNEADSEK